MTELKPCPFCANDVDVKWNKGFKNKLIYSIYGHKLSCFLLQNEKSCGYGSKEQAIKAWNTRANAINAINENKSIKEKLPSEEEIVDIIMPFIHTNHAGENVYGIDKAAKALAERISDETN